MSEMVERVARAILACGRGTGSWDKASDYERDFCMQEALAAIAAMREPTGAMIVAGEEYDEKRVSSAECAGCVEHWKAMIAAALYD